MQKNLGRLASAAILIWALSWLGLYLEIYRYHHVDLSRLGGVLWPPDEARPRPGGFARGVVAASIAAPVLWGTLSIWMRLLCGRTRGAKPPAEAGWGLPVAALACGTSLAVLGTVNQLVRRPPLQVDLTLRSGNGGFVVIGLALVAVGIWVRRARAVRAR